jgi:hypothetical protein
MRKVFRTKRRKIIASGAVVGLIMSFGGAAWAYYALASTSQPIAMTTAAQWNLTSTAATGTALAPGIGSEVVGWSLVNPTGSSETVSNITAALKVDGSGNVIDATSSNPVVGCKASWFTLALTQANSWGGSPATGTASVSLTSAANLPTPGGLPIAGGGGGPMGTVTVTMPADAIDNQGPCSVGIAPLLVITVS